MISLLQRSSSKSIPNFIPIYRPSHLQSDLQVSAFNSEIKSRLLVLNEVKCDLGISLLLEVSDNALPDQIGVSDDLEDLIVILSHKSKLESVFRRIDGDRSGCTSSVEAMDYLTLYSSKVDGLIESLDDTVVADYQLLSIRNGRERLTPGEEHI